MASDWFDGAGTGEQVDVVKMLDSAAGQGIATMVQDGALVSLSLTSDGGALGVTVTVDGRYRREYFREQEALESWLAEAIPAVQVARRTSSPPAGNGSRRTGRRAA